jgi:hypothetical protein
MVNKDRDIWYQTLMDDILYGESIVHIDKEGNMRRIQPYSEEYFKILEDAE